MASSGEVRTYLERANDFLDGMHLLSSDQMFRNSTVLLAIHSAISYTDALRTGLGDSTLSSEDHRNAAKSLRRLLSGSGIQSDNGLRQLEALLSRKSAVAYGDRHIEHTEFESILLRAVRYARWANQVAGTLQIEGWRHPDE